MVIRETHLFWIGFFLCIVILSGCDQGNQRLDVDVSNISLADVKIHRYDVDLFKVRKDHLRKDIESLKPEYPVFLDTDLGSPETLESLKSYLESPRTIGFHAAVDSQFRNISALEKDLTEALKHYLYYYPGFKVPDVYTYISGGEYDYPVAFGDHVLVIGLDNYLGSRFKPYVSDGLPAYRMFRMEPSNIIPDCMNVLGKIAYPNKLPGNNLLAQMIEAGKRLLFMEAMMPQTEKRLLIGYSKEQYDWIAKNEAHVWAAIIENRMLYTTDGKQIRTFMADGPFTAEFSKDAPARLGEWLGWQIVRQFYEKNREVTLQMVMNETDAQKTLSNSAYKPKK